MQGFLADTNIWVALQFKKHPHHQVAVGFMETRAEETPVFFARIVEQSFLAAFAIRAGIPFATLDSDFRRFEAAGLKLCQGSYIREIWFRNGERDH